MEYPRSKANTWTLGYRNHCAAINPKAVDFPAPDGPTIRVWPTSETCKLKRNGVAPLVAAYRSVGLPLGISGEGFSRKPAQTEVIGSMSARFNVWSNTRRTFEYPSPGRVPRQASTALMVSMRQEKPRF